jgi:hypothetical protein
MPWGGEGWTSVVEQHFAMTVVRRVVVGAALAMALGVLATLLIWVRNPVTVRITNGMSEAITDVVIATREETMNQRLIRPSDKWQLTVHPRSESDLELRFVDARGRRCGRNLDVYLENGVRGSVDLQVIGCSDVEVRRRLYQL